MAKYIHPGTRQWKYDITLKPPTSDAPFIVVLRSTFVLISQILFAVVFIGIFSHKNDTLTYFS